MWRMASVVCTEVPSRGILRFTYCVPLLVNLRVGYEEEELSTGGVHAM